MSPDSPKAAPDDELVPADDAIIGRGVRWSFAVAGLLALAGLIVYLVARRPAPPEPVREKTVGEVRDLERAATLPEVSFVDRTAPAGLHFVHQNGARGEKLLPETMGSGAAFFDYDGDGDPDLFLANARPWPDAPKSAQAPTQALYRNDGTGRFEDVTAAAGLDVSLYATGVATGDYDADGDIDLFLAALGPNRLFENRAGHFVDVTAKAGVAGDPEAWSTSAGFFDYDLDSDLDLFVCNYVKWSKAIDYELNFTLNGKDRAYGPPTNYEGAFSYLYRNDGAGRFTDVSEAAGIRVVNKTSGRPMGKALAVTFADVDEDGFIDVLVANDTVQNFLFHNLHDGRFEEIGGASGIGFDSTGNATGAMGIDAGHHRDGEGLAVAIGNFANEMTSFYVARAPRALLFTDEAAGEGIGSPSRLFLKFGLFFFDYDLDGRLDLLEANGHLEEAIHDVQASQTYRQRAQLFWNAGPEARAAFSEVPADKLGDLSRPLVGRGATYADIDGDGDLDVLLTEVAGPPLLLANDQRLGHHWLRVKLAGAGQNRDAIGAWLELDAGGHTQRRQVMPTRSYLSQVELPVTFGLATAERVDELRVLWPDGTLERVTVPEVDRTIQVTRGSLRR